MNLSSIFHATRWSSLVWLLLLSLTLTLQAHDPGLSTVDVRLKRDAIDIVLVMSIKDLAQVEKGDQSGGGASPISGSKANESAPAPNPREPVLITIDDRPAKPTSVARSFDKNSNATFQLTVPGRPVTKLQVRSAWLATPPPGHRQFVCIRDVKGRVLAERLLSASSDSALLSIASGDPTTLERAAGNSLPDFVILGLKHILTGYDHLLFIIALVLAAGTFWDLVKVVTAFTLAHTATLALSALNLLRLPSNVVEPMIAGSIVLVALTNVFWPERSRGWPRLATAFFFGLFHGLGFAGGLLSATEGSAGFAILLAIAAFSLGVELGHQLIVLPVFLGLKLARARTAGDDASREGFARVAARSGSLLITVAGTFYLIAALR